MSILRSLGVSSIHESNIPKHEFLPCYVVIPTRNRRDQLAECVSGAFGCEHIFIIDNGSDPPIQEDDLPNTTVIRNDMQPPNISLFWNLGIRAAVVMARERGHDKWNVAVLNDDAYASPKWFQYIGEEMRKTSAVMASSDQFRGITRPLLHGRAEPVDLQLRMTGYAFMLRGEALMEADEQFRWWYGDDDLDWTARQRGGALLVPGCPVRHKGGPTEGILAELATQDRGRFQGKWGRTPH